MYKVDTTYNEMGDDKMRFKKKIVALFLGFAIAISIIVSISYTYIYTMNSMHERENTLQYLASMNCKQFENLMFQMESVYEYLLSDMEFLDAEKKLSSGKYGGNYPLASYSDEGYTVQKKLNIVYIYQFYRVVYFNNNGTNFNNTFPRDDFNKEKSAEDITWLSNIEKKVGEGYLIPMHEDDWGLRTKKPVISYVRRIIGDNRGYIEVQMDQEHLNQWFQDESGKDYVFLTPDGNLIYSSDVQYSTDYYKNLILDHVEQSGTYQREDSKSQICMAVRQNSDGVVAAVFSDNVNILDIIKSIIPFSLLILLAGILVSLAYIEISTCMITKPLRILKEYIRNVNLDNMTQPLEKNISNDEINELYLAFQYMTGRLKNAITEKEQMALLQMNTQMDLLQSQINPHFINNVLNAISNQAVLHDNFEICDMCTSLSRMLRYSTNTKDKITTLKQEFEYVEQYIRLMKLRYEHRLDVDIHLDESLQNEKIPKIVLHQFVENSIQHGYDFGVKTMRIRISSEKQEQGWCIAVTDNGRGFENDKLKKLRKNISETRHKLEEASENVQLEIGGMGIINTYARLYMYFGNRLIFDIENLDCGVQVRIGCKDLDKEKCEVPNV